MPYVPDPTDPTNPLDTEDASTAAAEFRAFKAYVQSVLGAGTGVNPFRKNMIINGDMSIDQRNEGGASGISGTYLLDRWVWGRPAAATIAVQRQNIAFTETGFFNVIAMNITVPAVSAPGEVCGLYQPIEGSIFSRCRFGTAAALPVSISFWIRSPLVGIHCVSLRNSATDRAYVSSISIAVIDTWEFKTVVIPGDVAGTWLATTGTGVTFGIDFGSHSGFNAAALNVWSAGNFLRTAAQVDTVGTGGFLAITGVQAEQAGASSPFEVMDPVQNLLNCRRYFQKSYGIGVIPGTVNTQGMNSNFASGAAYLANIPLVPPMRTIPSVIVYSPQLGNAGNFYNFSAGFDVNGSGSGNTGSGSVQLQVTGPVADQNHYGVHFTASAEL